MNVPLFKTFTASVFLTVVADNGAEEVFILKLMNAITLLAYIEKNVTKSCTNAALVSLGVCLIWPKTFINT